MIHRDIAASHTTLQASIADAHVYIHDFPYPDTDILTGGAEVEPDIDRIFGKTVDRILLDHDTCPADVLAACDPAAAQAMRTAPGYTVGVHPLGVVAMDAQGRLCGVYFQCDLAVLSEYQGQGIGAELVAWMLLQDGGLAVWEHDTPAFSPAGRSAHLAAGRLFARGVFSWNAEADLTSL